MEPVTRLVRRLMAEAPYLTPGSASTRSSSEHQRAILVGTFFCLSGVPALIYQIAWQRILVFQSGVGSLSVAMIVAAYMAGLGIGSLAGGCLSRRLPPRTALVAYAGLELAIGCFALVSGPLYYDLLYIKGSWPYHTPWRIGLGHFLALLPPTCLMGMTFPLLVQAMVRSGPTAARTIGELYSLNVLGAAIGALLTPWVLIRYLGIIGTIRVGIGCNLLVGIGVLAAGQAFSDLGLAPEPETSPGQCGGSDGTERRPFGLWIALYTLSGFYAIALEIIWFRLIDIATKAMAFTFGTVLAVYLLGLTTGSLIGARREARVRDPLGTFLLCQCLILIYVGLEVILLARLPIDFWGYRAFFAYWGAYEPLGPAWQNLSALLALYGGLPILLFGIPTCLMGLSFTVLQRAVHDRRHTSGYKVGILQFANIMGCVAGSLLVGLLFFSALGTTGTVRAMIGSGSAFAALGFSYARPRSRFAIAGLALIALATLLPDRDRLWQRLHGRTGGPALFEEDETGVIALFPETSDRWRLSINGKGQSLLPYGGIHSRLGALPVTLHPAPQRIAIIGLGSGDTAWAAACRPETRRMIVFEICPTQPRLLRRLSALTRLPHLDQFLHDRRVTILGADGRQALATDQQTYDLIEADAVRPDGAYGGNLYSVEFFRLCAGKLNPGGLMCSWSPTPRTRATFRQAFAHVMELDGGAILIGSNQPIAFDPVTWRERLCSRAVAEYLGREVLSECLSSLAHCRSLPAASSRSAQINSDLFPRDEYQSP